MNTALLCVRNWLVRLASSYLTKKAKVYITHYVDDLLISHPESTELAMNFVASKTAFRSGCLQIAPEKIQKVSPLQYLDKIIGEHTVHPQKLEIHRDFFSKL